MFAFLKVCASIMENNAGLRAMSSRTVSHHATGICKPAGQKVSIWYGEWPWPDLVKSTCENLSIGLFKQLVDLGQISNPGWASSLK